MQKKTTVCAIVAVGPDGVIGKDGVMPWHSKADFYHFKKITVPYPCIFGRTTFENLPTRPLPGRLNVVCSSKYQNKYFDGVFYANSLESALKECSGYPQIFICGGAQIYKYAFDKDLVDVFYLTMIDNEKLLREIQKNPNAYCRFKPDVSEFFDSATWVGDTICYPSGVLPKEASNTIIRFFKFNRVR